MMAGSKAGNANPSKLKKKKKSNKKWLEQF